MRRRIIRIDRVWAWWLVSLVLTGCASEVPPPVGPLHPASANAPESPPTVISMTLDIQTRPMLPAAPPADGQKDMDHHSPGMPGMEMPGDTPSPHSSHDQNEVQPSTTPGRTGGQP